MKLKANAEAFLDNFKGRGSYSNMDTLGHIKVYPGKKLSRNAFFVNVNGQIFVGKIGLATPGLKELGLTDLQQVASHHIFVPRQCRSSGLIFVSKAGLSLQIDTCAYLSKSWPSWRFNVWPLLFCASAAVSDFECLTIMHT